MDTKVNLTDTSEINLKDNHDPVREDSPRNSAQRALLFKTERLVSAIHLVTSLMDSEDSLRRQLRTVSVESLADFYYIGHWQINDGKKFIAEKIYTKILHIVSLLDVGFSGGLISSMNYRILREEYLKLKGALERLEITSGTNSFVLPKNFFGADLGALDKLSIDEASVVPRSLIITADRPQTTKDNKVMSARIGVAKNHKGHSSVKKTLSGHGKLSRQDMIIEVLKDGKFYTIKEIINGMSVISKDVDRSEKTIQRDLTTLVVNKRLIKLGERRWSRYSLAVVNLDNSS